MRLPSHVQTILSLVPKQVYILLIGNPLEGYQVIGPFSSIDEAEQYGDDHRSTEEWWVMELQSPAISPVPTER